MNWYEINAYASAIERELNERLILQMNAMSLAFGGGKDDRQKFIRALLGIDENSFDAAEFELLFPSLATPVDANPELQSMQAWARQEIAKDDSGILGN
jgi:hypothetical protein